MNSCTYQRRVWHMGHTMGYTLLLYFTAHAQPVPMASVRGTVINAATGEGLRKAYLLLLPSGRRDGYPVATNDQGVFAIENVAPGNYRLSAESRGIPGCECGRSRRGVAALRGATS